MFSLRSWSPAIEGSRPDITEGGPRKISSTHTSLSNSSPSLCGTIPPAGAAVPSTEKHGSARDSMAPSAVRSSVRSGGVDLWASNSAFFDGGLKTRRTECPPAAAGSQVSHVTLPGPDKQQHFSAAQSLLFDFESGDASNAPATSQMEDDSSSGSVLSEVQQLYQTTDAFERQLKVDVLRFKRQCYEEEGRYDNVVLASMLAGVGYRIRTREALGGGVDFLHNLRHTFLCVAPAAEPDGSSLAIVEPHLKDHFEISSPSPAYKVLIDSLPEVFVGNKERLAALVNLLCREMALAFCASGRMLPPWRKHRSMLSKWFPENVKDTDVMTAYGPPKSLHSVELPPEAPVGDDWIPFQFGTSHSRPW